MLMWSIEYCFIFNKPIVTVRISREYTWPIYNWMMPTYRTLLCTSSGYYYRIEVTFYDLLTNWIFQVFLSFLFVKASYLTRFPRIEITIVRPASSLTKKMHSKLYLILRRVMCKNDQLSSFYRIYGSKNQQIFQEIQKIFFRLCFSRDKNV